MAGAAGPNMHRNASQVDERQLRVLRSTNHVFDVAILMMDTMRGRAFRHSLRRGLLIKAIATHTIRTALKRQQAIVDIWPELVEYRIVIASQIELGVAFVWPENLVRVGDEIVDFHGSVTSSARLSSRNPRKTGWRNLR